MKTYNVEIVGIAPLLQNRFAEEEHGVNKTKAKTTVYEPEKKAETASYKDEDGKIVHPTEHIYAASIKAGSYFKFQGRKTYKDPVKGGVVFTPEYVPILDSQGREYSTWDEIDARGVVVSNARIIRWRPRYNEGWRLQFQIQIIDDDNIAPSALKDILDKAGSIGIGDYRPRFGRFQVTKWEEDNGQLPTKEA